MVTTCPGCSARILQDELVDPETGDRYPLPWCPGCGADLPQRPGANLVGWGSGGNAPPPPGPQSPP